MTTKAGARSSTAVTLQVTLHFTEGSGLHGLRGFGQEREGQSGVKSHERPDRANSGGISARLIAFEIRRFWAEFARSDRFRTATRYPIADEAWKVGPAASRSVPH